MPVIKARRAARGRQIASGTARPTCLMEMQRQIEYSASCSCPDHDPGISAVNDQLVSFKTHLISTNRSLVYHFQRFYQEPSRRIKGHNGSPVKPDGIGTISRPGPEDPCNWIAHVAFRMDA